MSVVYIFLYYRAVILTNDDVFLTVTRRKKKNNMDAFVNTYADVISVQADKNTRVRF